MSDENYQKLKDYALKLISFRPRSSKELKGKLLQFAIKRKIPKKLIKRLMDDLTDQNLLNDEDFVKWWVEQRQTFKPKGRRAIESELVQKGVSREIIESVLASGMASQSKEFDLACKAASKKAFSFKRLSKKETKYKLGSFLARRGFDWEVIYKVIDSLIKKS